MKQRLHFAALLVLASFCQAQVVDRMVAVVNKHVILESELDQAARVEFLLQGKPLGDGKFTRKDVLAVLDRLVDQALLDQQIINQAVLDPTPAELSAQIKEVRKQVTGAATDEGWKSVLTAYGLTEQDIAEQLTSQSRILRFVDLRFRGLVRVEKDTVDAYYQDKLLPELRKRGAPEPKLSEVSGRIENVLVEQRIDELLANWLQTLRSQAHIEKMLAEAGNATPGATP
jgi:parvulin-like peptidyl-prolyl isomerase